MPAQPATPATAAANAHARDTLPFTDEADFQNADRRLVAAASGDIKDANGTVVWSIDQWSFSRR